MDVVSIGPLRVASLVWQPRAGAWALTIACKATFDLRPGVSPLAGAQEEPAGDDGYWDGDEARSLGVPSDLVPFKARADVLVVGHAFAPAGQRARSLSVRLVVGTVDKGLEVWCDRIFWQDGRLLEGQPFASIPLRWERAAGGPGTANPVGMRFDAPPDAYGSVPIPNLQPPDVHVARRGDVFAPVGLGPIAPHWPHRAQRLGRHADGWSHRRWRERPLPGDLDRAYFNAAPPDQQVTSLAPDERIMLDHLHAEHPHLETQLPGVRPVARMTAGGRAGEEIALTADTLCIDTDRGLATMVWRGRVPLTHAAEEGQVTVSMDGAAPGGEVAGTVLLGPQGEPYAPALPFGGQPAPPPQPVMETLMGGRAGAPALPFEPAKSPWLVFQPQPAASTPAPAVPADTGTIYGVSGKAHGVLPMTWIAPEPSPLEPIKEVEIDATATPSAVEPAAPEPTAAVEPPAPGVERTASELPIERCAAIAASIARRKAETGQILEENGLGPAEWEALRQRWDQAIRAETARGRTALLEVYDRGYVARLEEERGPIRMDEYARLVVAAERGCLANVLAEMTLPRGAMLRIERVWLGKLGADPDLGKRLMDATRTVRETE